MNRFGRAGLVAVCIGLAGCAAVSDVRDPAPPPDAVQIRVYTNGGVGGPGVVRESVRWMFRSLSDAQWGVVTHIPEATCIRVGARWSLSIDDDGAAIPIAKSRHDQFSVASPLDLTIERDPVGGVTVSEGLPKWMHGKPIGCAPL